MKLDKQLVTINPSTFINAWFHHNHLISFSIFQVIHSFLQCHYKRAFGLGKDWAFCPIRAFTFF